MTCWVEKKLPGVSFKLMASSFHVVAPVSCLVRDSQESIPMNFVFTISFVRWQLLVSGDRGVVPGVGFVSGLHVQAQLSVHW